MTDLPKFYNWQDAQRYATDLLQFGDDGPCAGDLTETIEAALEEAKRLRGKNQENGGLAA